MAVESEEFTELGDELALGVQAGLSAADLAAVRQRVPHIQLITVPGVGADIAVTQPAALAAALDHLLTTDQVRQ